MLPFFAPQLFIRPGVKDISFYEKAFGAVELRRFTNDDNSIHVAELSIAGALFHIHEEKSGGPQFSPETIDGITTIIGLFVPDVDETMAKAVIAGASEVTPAQSFEYGYRQGQIRDPFGHVWLIQTRI